jgi:hypothetical protein
MSSSNQQNANNTRKEGLGFDGVPQHRLKIKKLTKEKLTTKKDEEHL